MQTFTSHAMKATGSDSTVIDIAEMTKEHLGNSSQLAGHAMLVWL